MSHSVYVTNREKVLFHVSAYLEGVCVLTALKWDVTMMEQSERVTG